MNRSGTPRQKALFAEMTIILLVAALIGISWNHRLLYQTWTGRGPQQPQESAQPLLDIPLPLGLMEVKELYDRKEAAFVDARDAAAFAKGHIRQAHPLPLGEFDALLPRFIAQVPPSATLIVYCNGYDCHDSRDLGARLLRSGYRTVYVFEGGYPEWRDAGYPTEGGKR